jgi:hypothetical protein
VELRVHKVRQMASGASYVAISEADVELSTANPDIAVEVVSVRPADAQADKVAAARGAIRAGAESVLRPRGLGAVIRVRGLVVHPVDFSPARYEMHTSEELLLLLPAAEPRSAPDAGREND